MHRPLARQIQGLAPGQAQAGPTRWASQLWPSQHRKLVVGLLLAAGLLLATDPAYAGWGFWVAAVALVALAVVAFVPVAATVATYVFFIAAVGWGIAIAKGQVFSKPTEARSPEPTDSKPLALHLVPIPLLGDQSDTLVGTVNGAIAAASTLSDHAQMGTGNLRNDLAALDAALAPAGAQFDSLMAALGGPVPRFGQADVDAVMADIGANGMPQRVADAMRDAGLSSAEIQAFGADAAAAHVQLAGPSISVGEVFNVVANLRLVPEPASMPLAVLGLLAAHLAVAARRRRPPLSAR